MNIDNKRIFITGGASGLGLAVAMHYAKKDWNIAIGDINHDRLEEAKNLLLQHSMSVLALECDVTKEADLQSAGQELNAEWGGIDIVINNAGVATAGAIDQHSIDDWEWVTNINLLGVVRGCKVFTSLFKKQGHGYFVNIASMAGLTHPPLMSSYNATKAAVVALSETLEVELAPYNIGVSVVCPGFFRTNLNESMRSDVKGMDVTLNKLFDRSPVNADDVANDIAAAVQAKQFFVLPHKDGKQAFMLKRLLPHKHYINIIKKRSAKMLKKSNQAR